MMEIVNGVACFNCTDMERAKKKKSGGEDPKAEKATGPGGTGAAAKVNLEQLAARAH